MPETLAPLLEAAGELQGENARLQSEVYSLYAQVKAANARSEKYKKVIDEFMATWEEVRLS